MDLCFHAEMFPNVAKFWHYLLNVTAEIWTLCFWNILYCNSREAVQIKVLFSFSKLAGVTPGLVFCYCNPFAPRFNVWWMWVQRCSIAYLIVMRVFWVTVAELCNRLWNQFRTVTLSHRPKKVWYHHFKTPFCIYSDYLLFDDPKHINEKYAKIINSGFPSLLFSSEPVAPEIEVKLQYHSWRGRNHWHPFPTAEPNWEEQMGHAVNKKHKSCTSLKTA